MTVKQQRPTTTATTIESIRDLIASGELLAGESLRQEELSARLGVSRTPLREAIVSLQVEGLIVNYPRKGAVVFKPSAEELQEIYELRILLETKAAKDATPRVTKHTIGVLESLVMKMAKARDSWGFATLNRKFRLEFYSCSGKRQLVDLIRQLTHRAEPYVTILAGGPCRPSVKDYNHLLDAIRSGDGTLAARITRAHLAATVKNVLPMVNRSSGLRF